jgi:hypothetical protein
MKKIPFIVLLLFLSGLMFAQTQQDKQEVLQLCIDLPELQSHLVDESGQPLQQLTVMSNENLQPEEVSIAKFGKAVRVVDLETINDLELNPYIVFNTFEIGGNIAKVHFQLARRSSSLWYWYELQLAFESEKWQIVELKAMEE